MKCILNIIKLKLLNQYKSLADYHLYLSNKFSSDGTVLSGSPVHFYLFFPKPALPEHTKLEGTSILFPQQIPVDLQGVNMRPMEIR